MLKTTAVAAIATGFLMIGSPAVAAEDHGHHGGPWIEWTGYEDDDDNDVHQTGLLEMEDSELLGDLNLCGLELQPNIPILADNDEIECYSEDDNQVAVVDNETGTHDG